jgi:hypothetical protein
VAHVLAVFIGGEIAVFDVFGLKAGRRTFTIHFSYLSDAFLVRFFVEVDVLRGFSGVVLFPLHFLVELFDQDLVVQVPLFEAIEEEVEFVLSGQVVVFGAFGFEGFDYFERVEHGRNEYTRSINKMIIIV